MKLNNSNKYNINDSNYPEMKGFLGFNAVVNFNKNLPKYTYSLTNNDHLVHQFNQISKLPNQLNNHPILLTSSERIQTTNLANVISMVIYCNSLPSNFIKHNNFGSDYVKKYLETLFLNIKYCEKLLPEYICRLYINISIINYFMEIENNYLLVDSALPYSYLSHLFTLFKKLLKCSNLELCVLTSQTSGSIRSIRYMPLFENDINVYHFSDIDIFYDVNHIINLKNYISNNNILVLNYQITNSNSNNITIDNDRMYSNWTNFIYITLFFIYNINSHFSQEYIKKNTKKRTFNTY
jgi:hypothetical protein